ncbi:hypothetical protein ACHQM5_005335 [Ranunculus cassubicifolius]
MGNPGKPSPGKTNYDPSIQHFSHEHQLQLLNIKDQPTLDLFPCAGCKFKPTEWVYVCKPCNFFIDIPCSKIPKLLQHPADPNHTFTLLAKPAYPCGEFSCDACGKNGDGFSYNCSICGLDIHTICATMPFSVTHQTHPHPLNLVFSPPYPSKEFTCDICHRDGSNQWVYRCDPCGFDAHINCATSQTYTEEVGDTSFKEISDILIAAKARRFIIKHLI